jgi:hypothetical protein
MATIDEQILRASKEIVVKFIETGRVSPMAFPETFENIYRAVNETVKSVMNAPQPLPTEEQESPNPSPKKEKK